MVDSPAVITVPDILTRFIFYVRKIDYRLNQFGIVINSQFNRQSFRHIDFLGRFVACIFKTLALVQADRVGVVLHNVQPEDFHSPRPEILFGEVEQEASDPPAAILRCDVEMGEVAVSVFADEQRAPADISGVGFEDERAADIVLNKAVQAV